jgi:hypothetical protein
MPNKSLDPNIFLADFHVARAHSLRNSHVLTAERWKIYLDALNQKTAETLFRRNSVMLWIAIGAAGFISLFFR